MMTANPRLRAFPPIEAPDARVLILGSMPSLESLEKQQYYAHPRNQFWRLISRLLNEPCPEDYSERQRILLEHGIALWDVLDSCRREGSADSAIREVVVNEFEPFFAAHSSLHTIMFNGTKAYQLFCKYVHLSESGVALDLLQLPSTSPAHVVPFEVKLDAWREAFIKAGFKNT